MVTIRKELAPVKINVNCSGYGNGKKYLTIHQTGNTSRGANAAMHARLQFNNPRDASWHYQVDNEEAVQSFEHGVRCWHASDGSGDGNMNSIAIEGCINSDGDYVKSVQNMAELAAKILKDEGIPIGNMKQHYDWARDKKNCPAQIRAGKDGINWAKFVQMVQAELDKLNGKEGSKTATAVKKEKPKEKEIRLQNFRQANVYEKPSFSSKVINSKKKDSSVRVSHYVYGEADKGGNKVWLLVDKGTKTEGYIHDNNFLGIRRDEVYQPKK